VNTPADMQIPKPQVVKAEVEDPFAAAMAGQDVRGRSLWVDAWHRLLKNKAAVISGIIMFIMLLLVIAGPLVSPWEGDFTDWDNTASPPNFETGHWFGTDAVGRDILVRTLEGGRISLLVGLVATLVSLAIGVTYGAVAGYYGGFTDRIMMRLVDIIYALPFMFFVILLMVVFGRHIVLIFVAIGAVNWLDMARIVRGQTLGLKNTEFVEAARACGVDHKAIIRRHIIPNLLGVVMVYVTLTIPQVILVESFLSFLGLGVQEPMSSWGALVNDGAQDMESAPWTLVFPATFLTVTLYCFNYIGDGMRDALTGFETAQKNRRDSQEALIRLQIENGVDPEAEIVAIRKMAAERQEIAPEEVDLSNVEAFYVLDGAYIDGTLDQAIAEYGSMEAYIRDGLGITEAEIERLREELLQ